jgi:hypothetical protein
VPERLSTGVFGFGIFPGVIVGVGVCILERFEVSVEGIVHWLRRMTMMIALKHVKRKCVLIFYSSSRRFDGLITV